MKIRKLDEYVAYEYEVEGWRYEFYPALVASEEKYDEATWIEGKQVEGTARVNLWLPVHCSYFESVSAEELLALLNQSEPVHVEDCETEQDRVEVWRTWWEEFRDVLMYYLRKGNNRTDAETEAWLHVRRIIPPDEQCMAFQYIADRFYWAWKQDEELQHYV